jgi:hypothetical protein
MSHLESYTSRTPQSVAEGEAPTDATPHGKVVAESHGGLFCAAGGQIMRLVDQNSVEPRTGWGVGRKASSPGSLSRVSRNSERGGISVSDLWTYPITTWRDEELGGYDVEALDGEVGTVDEATYVIERSIERSYLVVDTGPWIFGKKVVLPAGLIDRIDAAQKTIYVDRTKEQIKNAPEYDEGRIRTDSYHAELGRYYGRGGAGYPKTASTPSGIRSG